MPIYAYLFDSLTNFARFYQFGKPSRSGFGSFRGGDPVKHLFFIAGRAGFKVSPGCFFTLESDEFFCRQLGGLGLFERVNP